MSVLATTSPGIGGVIIASPSKAPQKEQSPIKFEIPSFLDTKGIDRLKKTWLHVRAITYPSDPSAYPSVETTQKAKEAFHTIALEKTYVPTWLKAIKAITVLCPFILGITLMIEELLIDRHTDELTKKFSILLASIELSSVALVAALESHNKAEEGLSGEKLTPEKAMELLAQLGMDIDNFTKAFDTLAIPQDNDHEHFHHLRQLRGDLSKLSQEADRRLKKMMPSTTIIDLNNIQSDLNRGAGITVVFNEKNNLTNKIEFTRGSDVRELLVLLAKEGLSLSEIFLILPDVCYRVFEPTLDVIQKKVFKECEPKDIIPMTTMIDSAHGVDRIIDVTINISKNQIKISAKCQVAIIEVYVKGQLSNRVQSQEKLEANIECSRHDHSKSKPVVESDPMKPSSAVQAAYYLDSHRSKRLD